MQIFVVKSPTQKEIKLADNENFKNATFISSYAASNLWEHSRQEKYGVKLYHE